MYLKSISLGFIWFVMLSATFFSDFLPMPHGAYAEQRFILCLSLIFLIALTMPSFKFRVSKIVTILPFMLTLILGGYLSNLNPFAWLEPILYCLFFIATCFLGNFIVVNDLQIKASQYLIGLTIIVCFFYASLSVMLYVFSLEKDLSNFSQVMPAGFVNIRYWSHTASLLLPLFPLAVIGYEEERFRIWRLMVMFTAAIWWWLAIHMMSRGSIFSLVLSTFMVLVIFRQAAFRWLKLMLFYFVLGFLTWFLLSYIVPVWILDAGTTLLRDINTTTSGRLPLWQEAWAMSLQNFPFGMGAQSWLTHDLLTDTYKEAHQFSHPHNMYLMWAAEYGWLSVLCLLGLVIWVFCRLKEIARIFAENSLYNTEVLIAYSVAVIAGSIHAGVSAVFIVPASMMLVLGVLSVFWALILPADNIVNQVETLKNPRLKRILSIFLFLVFSGWWITQVWKYHEAMLDDLSTEEGARAQDMAPRFWVYGNYPRADNLKDK